MSYTLTYFAIYCWHCVNFIFKVKIWIYDKICEILKDIDEI